jgi:hypothetical protein
MGSDTNLYRAYSVTTAVKGIQQKSIPKLHFVEVQVTWCRHGTEPAGNYIFFYGKRNEGHELEVRLSIHKES